MRRVRPEKAWAGGLIAVGAMSALAGASVCACSRPFLARDGTLIFPEKGAHGASVVTANGIEFHDVADVPDRVVVPIASGSLFTKIAGGFQEWLDIGLLEGELPKFNGAQADGCSPVATAFEAGQDFCRPVKPDTIAKSLAIGNPADGPYALDLARSTGGSIDSVSDDEIRAGISLLAQTTGIFTETAGGVTTAVLAKLAERGEIDPEERVVAYITGEGLKTLDAVRGTFEAWEIEPTVASFEQASKRVAALA